MRVFNYVCFSIILVALLKSLIRIILSIRFLNKQSAKSNKDYKKITVIIPAMNEVNNVKRSITHFKKLNKVCNVIYVTTSKEKNMATYNKIREEILLQKAKNIDVVNCPNKKGTMANQLNYAIKPLSKDIIVGIYNIDSCPEEKTFNYVMNQINDNTVLQQVSYFDDELKWVMKSAENWQNRWSLVYEMGKYLDNIKLSFKYCIGHGLFLYKCMLDKYGYFSEKDINEDNEFGYRLVINKVSIKPIPYMEKADFANSIKIYIKQQSTWVNGPLYAFKYYKDNKKSLFNLIITFLNFKAFLSWWLFPLICYIHLICAAFSDIKLFFCSLLMIIIYVTGINYIANKKLIKMGYIKQKYKINIISDFIFFIIHSFGSYITLFKVLIGKNTIKNKYNTEK